jgi:hypothetical protein
VLAELRGAAPDASPIGDHVFRVDPSAQVFLSLSYLDAVHSACPGSIQLAINDTGNQKHIAALYVERKGPYRMIRVPPFTSYTSVAPCDRADSLQTTISTLVADAHAFRLHLPPGTEPLDQSAVQAGGWTGGSLYTFYAPVGAAETVQQFWSENRKRTFAKFESSFVIDEEASAAATLADLVTGSYARHGRRPELSATAITRLVSKAVDTGIARLFVCRDEVGAAQAAAAFLVYGQAAWYWTAGSHPGPAMTVLIGTVVPRLHALGVKSFDFVGANTPSITEFKRRFGSVRQEYAYVSAVRRPELRAAMALRAAVASARRG